MDAVDDIKSRLDIEDVVGEFIELKRSGRNLKGLSPFTNERTPSFMVSPEKQIWHDFSSGRGGDMFSFLMEVEGLDFKGALEQLARKAGIDLDQYRSSGSGSNAKHKERLHEALEAATHFYQRQFTKHTPALEYVLKQRGFSKDIALEFRLGYSPENSSDLYNYLSKKGFKDNELKAAGLVTTRYSKPSDMFRGRLMVPLMDRQGRVIGFTARQLKDNKNAPKYINTPQTLLYDKGRHVYAFHLAKEAIRQQKYAVLVEGNLDVIAAHQAGTREVVATAGTALTTHHLKSMLHFTDDLRICFDQDSAGQNAIERSIGVAAEVGVSLSVLPLPTGKDPDDLIKSDIEAWRTILDKPVYAVDWLIERYEKQLDISTAQGKRAFSDVVLKMISTIKDSVEQDHYLGVISQKLEVSRDSLRAKLRQSQSKQASPRRKKPTQTTDTSVEDKARQERNKIQDHLMALALFQPAIRKSILSIPSEVLEDGAARKFQDVIIDKIAPADELSKEPTLKEHADYVKILELQFEELYKDLDLVELRDEASRIKTRLVEQYVKYKKQAILAKLEDADEDKQAELLTEVHQLNSLLRH
jgi:DNA primase